MYVPFRDCGEKKKNKTNQSHKPHTSKQQNKKENSIEKCAFQPNKKKKKQIQQLTVSSTVILSPSKNMVQ